MSSFLEVPDSFEGYDMDALKLDEAYLTVESESSEQLYLYSLSDDCVQCPFMPLTGELDSSSVVPLDSSLFTVSTRRGMDLLISQLSADYLDPHINDTSQPSCYIKGSSFGEFGVYSLKITGDGNCGDIQTLKEPVFIYGGMIVAVIVYLMLLGIITILPIVKKKFQHTGLAMCCRNSQSETEINLDGKNEEIEKKPVKKRVKSLDTFRGLAIVWMIFVNYGAGQYWFMGHATWDGLLVADLVFPWFMWIMGVCIPMGVRSSIKRGVPKLTSFLRIFKRSLKLFFLGIILNSLGGWNDLSKYRVPGVLQRFAICYFVVASVMLWVPEIKLKENKVCQLFGDVFSFGWQWLIYFVLVTVHVVVMFCLPVPDCPTGYIGPGGIHLLYTEGEVIPKCIGGATGYVDRWVLGVEHIYQNPTAKVVYKSGPFDPEGVLGSIMSIFQVFLGLVAGNILHHYKGDGERLVRWLVWGTICGVLGTILCMAGDVDAPIPVNKNLWSLSYVFVTSCFAFYLLALFYLLVDKLEVWSGSPLYQCGMNSIFLYCAHNVAYNLFPWHYTIGPMRTHASLLAECLWGTTLWVITGLYLHHKGKFYTV